MCVCQPRVAELGEQWDRIGREVEGEEGAGEGEEEGLTFGLGIEHEEEQRIGVTADGKDEVVPPPYRQVSSVRAECSRTRMFQVVPIVSKAVGDT